MGWDSTSKWKAKAEKDRQPQTLESEGLEKDSDTPPLRANDRTISDDAVEWARDLHEQVVASSKPTPHPLTGEVEMMPEGLRRNRTTGFLERTDGKPLCIRPAMKEIYKRIEKDRA